MVYILLNKMLSFTENKEKQTPTSIKPREEKQSGKQSAKSAKKQNNGPAWVDKGVENIKVSIEDKSRLRKLKTKEDETHIRGNEYAKRLEDQYSKIIEGNELFGWAALPQQRSMIVEEAVEEDLDPIAQLLKSNTSIFRKHDSILKSGKLDFTKLIPANYQNYHDSVTSSVNFHPREHLLVTCGLDRKAKLFNISAKKSHKVQSLFLPDLPIYSSAFINNGNQLVMAGNRKHFYYYDLASNKLEKVSHIMNHNHEKNLSKLYANSYGSNEYFAICGSGSESEGEIMVMS